MRTLIDEAAAIQSIEAVGFTGGECFLLGRELDALIARVNGHGLRTRVVTNGYWAVTLATARARVASLRAAGLDEMHLSTGMFHQRYVPVERVVCAARAAAEAGLLTSVIIEECNGSTFDPAVVHDGLADLTTANRVLILRQPWIANAEGKGEAQLSHDSALSRFRDGVRGGCSSILNVLSVTPDQNLIACCGYTMEAIPELCLGSIAERTLADVLYQAPNDLLKYWIHVQGPEAILAFVKRFAPEYRLPVESPDICQTCLYLHRDATAQRIVFEHIDAIPIRHIIDTFNARIVADERNQSPRRVPQ
jgi:hypothetical protein